jgi:mRNA-degrading endonuclease RelE of RelBE toxin-antitoxin system/predicted transcriptional regulator
VSLRPVLSRPDRSAQLPALLTRAGGAGRRASRHATMAVEVLDVRLPPQTLAWLDDLAARRGCSPERVVADLVEAEVAREAAPQPEDLTGRETARGGRRLASSAWQVVLVPQAARELEAFPPSLRSCVQREAEALAEDPLRGKPAGGRFRSGFRFAGSEWRLVYALDEAARTVRVLLVTTRERAVY